MDELPFIICLFLGAGLLLGLACKGTNATAEEKSVSAQPGSSSTRPSAALSEAPSAPSADAQSKDCKSCGGHSQTGKFCSFCGRAL